MHQLAAIRSRAATLLLLLCGAAAAGQGVDLKQLAGSGASDGFLKIAKDYYLYRD